MGRLVFFARSVVLSLSLRQSGAKLVSIKFLGLVSLIKWIERALIF